MLFQHVKHFICIDIYGSSPSSTMALNVYDKNDIGFSRYQTSSAHGEL